MKKLILLLILLIGLSSAFATMTTIQENFSINGYVADKPYVFKIFNNGNAIESEESQKTSSIEISDLQNTSDFVLVMSNGNLNKKLSFKVFLEPSSFYKELNNEVHDTGIKPSIVWNNNTSSNFISNNLGTITTVPCGYLPTNETVASFQLCIDSKHKIPEGNYKSTIKVNYSYDF